MEKRDIIEFFDQCAPTWDAEMIKSDVIIGKILDNAFVGEEMDVLDVACGTGVMFDYYLDRGVSSVTGIDIAPEMAKIASGKYKEEPKVTVICGDVEDYAFEQKFDCIVVYNAFPHFADPERLIGTLAGLLKEGGRLTVAHGASRKAIDRHHDGPASKVSCGLIAADQLKQIFEAWLEVEAVISNDQMYQVSGVKRTEFVHDHSFSHSHSHAHVHDNQKAVLNRLSRAIGHLEKVRRMVEQGDDCSDVLVQLAAVRSALDNTGKVILKDHMRHCIVDAAAAGDLDAIEDVCTAIDKFVK